MRRLFAVAVVAVLSALQLSACAAEGSGPLRPVETPEQLTLALIPNEGVDDLVETAKPLTDYLGEQLGIPVKCTVSKDYQESVEAIGAGEAHIAIASASQLVSAEDSYGAHAVLQDVRYGATTYAGQFITNNPDKYCEDEPVRAKYRNGEEYLYCNGTATAGSNTGQGPKSLSALKKLDQGTAVAFLTQSSPAGYQLPIMALESQGINPDDLKKVPVASNDEAVLAVYNGEAEVGFSFWDARSTVSQQDAPNAAEELVVFGYTEMYPNGGVALSDELPAELRVDITSLMDGYSEQSPEILRSIFDISDWAPADPDALDIARKVNDRFKN